MSVIELKDIKIKNFFKNDVLNLKEYPVKEIADYYYKRINTSFDLTILSSEVLRQELKDYIMLIFSGFDGKSHKSRIVTELFLFIPFLAAQQINSFFDVECNELSERYATYRNIKTREPYQLIANIYFVLTEYKDPRVGLDRDIWYLDKMKIEATRLSKVTTIKTINFTCINHVESRELVKKYFKYILTCTEVSISTITNELTICWKFCNSLNGKSILDATKEDCDTFLRNVEKNSKSINYYNKNVFRLYHLFDYLRTKELYTLKNPIILDNKKTEKYKKKICAIPDFVIFQIFNNLHLLPFNLMVMYVINYCTGMRVSDICQLGIDCTFVSKNHYFVKHYVQKMKKFQANLIPKAAYDLIQQQREIVLKKDSDAKYLFPAARRKDCPCSTQYYRNHLKAYVDGWNIKNENGTPYHFESHAYRHTISTVLQNDYNVDLAVIQLGVLGHTEINMSLAYAEHTQDRRTRFEKNYVGIDGKINGITSEADKQFLATAEWMSQNLETQTLPNGICTYPMKIGVCPHFDACLNCEYFRTSVDYLELHKQHLAKLENDIIIYEANGWLPNLETAKKQKVSLTKIIVTLEKEINK